MPRGIPSSPRSSPAALPLALPLALLAGAVLVLPGCVRRTIRITSDPSGALVWVNDREVGRTPVDVDFVHYGTYDVRVVHEGYEPLLTYGDAKPPLWDQVGLDFFAELAPMDLESTVEWHYELMPSPSDPEVERAELLDRARDLREVMVAGPAEDAAGETDPGTGPETDPEDEATTGTGDPAPAIEP